MPDFEKIIKDINLILQLIYGQKVPSWVSPVIGWILIIGIVLCSLWGILSVLSKIKELWIQNFLPLFYNREEKQRSIRRKTFAEHIEHEIIRLGRLEDWKDYRFTELEAEVEAEGRRRILSSVSFLYRTQSGLRREKSLSKALELSDERLILVEGEPGSGKSIALRHVTQKIASHAKKVGSTKSIIPIYVNLKELERNNKEDIDRNFIEDFILNSLKRINDRDVESFLDDEFHLGMQSGTWFFLFDSFDEIPEVLSSTEADDIIKKYSNAIDDFLHGMNHCRGVIASRQFRGPMRSGWPHFRVLPLSESRRLELIRKVNLKPKIQSELIGQLGTASQEIQSMASNPLFLSLLCEHMKNGHQFPENTHIVFESYVNSRLTRDEIRLQRRFKLNTGQIRAVAESIAFCMTADNALGLSPTRENLRNALARQSMSVNDHFDTILDALEYMKLARSEAAADRALSKPFTFAHRRFQEYFATSVVLREPSRVSPSQLLTDARWRETAVVMCQTQPWNSLTSIVEQINRMLTDFCSSTPSLIDTPVEYVIRKVSGAVGNERTTVESFPWPPASLHLLGLLQDGFTSRLKYIPSNIRMRIGQLLLTASERGTLSDKKWALEVSGTAPEFVLAHLQRTAFSNESQWVKDSAYRQAAHLTDIPPSISQGIRTAIIYLATTGRLRREKHTTQAHLTRLSHSADFLAAMQILLWLPGIDFGLHVALFMAILSRLMQVKLLGLRPILILGISLSISHVLLRISVGRLRSLVSLGRVIAFVALFLRSFIVLFCLLGGWAGVYPLLAEPFDWYVVFGGLLIVMYAPFAFWAAQTGKFISRRWIALLSLWPLLCLLAYFCPKATFTLSALWRVSIVLIKQIPTFLKGFPTLIKRLPMLFIKVIGRVVVPALALGVVIDFLISLYQMLLTFSALPWSWIVFVWDQYTPIHIIATALWYIVVAIVAIVMAGITVALAGACIGVAYRWACDWLQWRRWLRSHLSPMTFQELFEVASTYYNTLLQVQVIKFVREHHILIATKETEVSLRQMALEIEMRQRSARQRKREKEKASQALHTAGIAKSIGTGTTLAYTKLVSKANAEVLDELYKLLEDVRLVLRDTSTDK